jgi:hypothetical protein
MHDCRWLQHLHRLGPGRLFRASISAFVFERAMRKQLSGLLWVLWTKQEPWTDRCFSQVATGLSLSYGGSKFIIGHLLTSGAAVGGSEWGDAAR